MNWRYKKNGINIISNEVLLRQNYYRESKKNKHSRLFYLSNGKGIIHKLASLSYSQKQIIILISSSNLCKSNIKCLPI